MAKTQRPACTVQVLPSGTSWRPNSGKLQLDSFSVPYGQAQLELPIDATADLESIDPRDDTRLQIMGSSDNGATSRPFNLGIQVREVDYRRRVVFVEAATDEALLQQYAVLTKDDGARAHEASVRDVVDYVLGKIGASLEPGSYDADMTAAWPAENLWPDPAADDLSHYTAGTGTQTPTRSTDGAVRGTGYIVWRASVSSGGHYVNLDVDVRVTERQFYTISAHFLPVATSDHQLMVRFFDENDVQLGGNRWSGVVSCAGFSGSMSGSTADDWTLVDMTQQAPVGAAYMKVYCWRVRPSGAHEASRLDAIQITEGIYGESLDWRDLIYGGASDSSLYAYEWAGDPFQSISVRKPFVERLPELFEWEPGEYAWDFLQPLLTAAGLRLFCDELRQWWLIDPAEYVQPGLLRLTPNGNLTEGKDTITRADPEVFATGVVVKYSWRDTYGEDQVAFDAAGDPQNVVLIEYQRPFPGPGAAAAILARRNGSGRQQEVRALNDWTAQPAMVASIQLPDAPEQQGKISALDFDLGDAGTMAVQTRGLIDIPAGSWLAQDPALQWDDLGATTPTWDTY